MNLPLLYITYIIIIIIIIIYTILYILYYILYYILILRKPKVRTISTEKTNQIIFISK
jgi:hypothetical protein